MSVEQKRKLATKMLEAHDPYMAALRQLAAATAEEKDPTVDQEVLNEKIEAHAQHFMADNCGDFIMIGQAREGDLVIHRHGPTSATPHMVRICKVIAAVDGDPPGVDVT